MTTDLPVFPLDHLPLFGEADAPALIIRDTRYSYKELNLRIGRLASLLKEKGYAPGDRVATWLGKGEIACLMPLASVRAGLVHVPVNPVLKAPQVKHILSDSGARLLITNAARAIHTGRSRCSARVHDCGRKSGFDPYCRQPGGLVRHAAARHGP